MPMLRSLDQIDSSTLERYRRDPVAFIEENLVSPYNGERYRLVEAERVFIQQAFKLDSDGRLLYPLLVYGAIKKSRKTELAGLFTIALILLYGGRFAEAFICANTKDQAVDRCFTGCKRIIEASPLLRGEVKCTQDRIHFTATQSSITAIANDAAGLAGGHPCISVHDEAWAAPSGERGRRVYDQLIPVPSRKISCRLVVSHAGFVDPDHLLYQLYERGLKLPKIGTDLYAGDGLLMHWRHEPLHPWQDERWLHEMRRELLPGQFTAMIENRFASNAASYITGEMFDRCVRESGPRPGNPLLPIIVAVDAAPLKDNTAIVAITPEGDGVRFVYAKVFVPSPNNPLDFEETIEKTLLDLAKRYTLRVCVIDPREMYYLAQRLRKAGLKIEEIKQTPDNLIAMPQTLFELFRTERFTTFSNAYLRDTITRTVFEETPGGLRFSKNQTIKIDLVTALSMACLAATQRSSRSGYRLDVFDENFVDEDAPPPPQEPEPPPLTADANWWKATSRAAAKVPDADRRLNDYYQQIAMGIQWGLIR
jgi:hypothetical protein